ncbi:MAG: NAD kinase [Rhodospirillaceae bacterium]|nr:NAD kinase [Rhodospirillales bacterium]
MSFSKIAIVSADTEAGNAGLKRLLDRYEHVAPEEADLIVALGGDGFMLECLHRFIDRHVPIYGMNRGSVGFLMNAFREHGLVDRLRKAQPVVLHPLRMRAKLADGSTIEALAINEVSLLRQTRQAAKVRIRIDGKERLEELICDGVLVASPAGSTAYNLSAHGPIVPLGAGIMALTPISAFRPRRWRGALLPHTAKVTFEVLEVDKRPVSAVADYTEARDVTEVDVIEDRSIDLTLLFDPEHNLEERIIAEQFLP